MTRSLLVFNEIDGECLEAGTAYFTRRRSVLSTSFRYSRQYVNQPKAFALDPTLSLLTESHQVAGLPGSLADSAPDRWGRNLITKRAQALALEGGRTAPSLSEVDFLIAVSDTSRQGALRLKGSDTGHFLDPGHRVPKLIELPHLLRSADAIAADPDAMPAIRNLLDAGSASLGGARPKASVRDGDRLMIAKFPHRDDQWDVMAWEKVALDLAELSGIEVPASELIEIDGRHVLVMQRFDRRGPQRIGYISAMTLLAATDGEVRDYVEVAEALMENGSRTVRDLAQLWRRISFSVAIHNTDDHLRNHGLLRDGVSGWTLSPVFDINPNPTLAEDRTTGIGGARHWRDEPRGLLAYADVFGLSHADAAQIVREVVGAVSQWRRVAGSYSIPERERAVFAGVLDSVSERLSLTT